MTLETTEVRVNGVDTYVPSVRINDCTIIQTGGALKFARIFDEDLVVRAALPKPETFLLLLAASPLKSDIFVFAQRPPDNTPHHTYGFEWDNWAVANTTSFKTWWEALPQESRKNARAAEKKGVTVRCVPFDDALVHGIKRIYDETPIRQGRPFWHFGKSFEAVKKENATYLDRSIFIGAFFEEQLIGFIKIIQVDEVATLIQILAMAEHRDKKPMNALLKHTMEVCEQRGFASLVYGNYTYGNDNDSSLTEFKRRNGYSEVRFPRYFVPLTLKGRLALKLGLHLGWKNLIPLPIRTFYVRTRAKLLSLRSGK
jgi:Acetyltransferase (GNAT) family